MKDRPSWNLTTHVRGALAEALVAEAVHRTYSDTMLHTPRHPGFDVSSVIGDIRVDAKAASILEVPLDGNGTVEALEWNNGSRTSVLHETASHLGLVVLDDSRTDLRLFDGAQTTLEGTVTAHGRVFLIPSEIAQELAVPIWSERFGRPSRGQFRYLRLVDVESHEFNFDDGSPPQKLM